MNKNQLQNRMIVETRGGERFLLIDGVLYNHCSFVYLSYYHDNMMFKCRDYPDQDIVKVYEKARYIPDLDEFDPDEYTLEWERDDEEAFFNGKTVFIGGDMIETGFTIGRFYEFKDGKTIDDDGAIRPYSDPLDKNNLKSFGFVALVD